MKWKEQILTLKAYQPGRTTDEVKKAYGLQDVVKLASNENPFGSSERVTKSIREYADSFAIYPDGYTTSLRKELASFLNVSEKQLIFGNGSDEIILMLSRAMLEPGKNTVMPTPSFPQYRHNAIVEGAEIREVELVNGAHDLDKMAQAIDENTAIVWLCSPNNPTGVHITDVQLRGFLDRVPEGVLIVLDEAYYEYVTASDYYDALEIIKEYKNVIVLRTFSKVYGLAAFRVGYGIADESLIAQLDPVREPFNVNSVGQVAAAAALSDQSFIEQCRTANKEGLEQFYAFCRENNLAFHPSEANFILIDFNCDSNELFEYLMSKGYIVRSGAALGIPGTVRVTVGSKEQNEGVIEAMKSFLAETVKR
ncbi:histidinol-phosphate transaminase [Domibacillus sp. DTU_2020_1001157_1_SI_ALB_TIR_016]|uniref:histidinol-phosphate transaminase n=1 Tax=Domibacillus sp. DTU_2020_1001157_1_SI_ALB_TIR_016 TaxID=3077789 RepID=UPI0028ED64EA|nr:histidinol-phosphate transaminase [Domibacillus sp. DTU_2020_1001157_1_SI_ALB_TIR_016]WNS82088.1 histidinol-phosphate transaminase [Domibacillus sp. DTU_2020_1001157_1_SI_ALB_TIR_016]